MGFKQARSIRDFCKKEGVVFHMKQIGSNPVNAVKTNFKGDKVKDIPEDLLIREYPNWYIGEKKES